MSSPLWKTIKGELFSPFFFAGTLFVGFLYLVLSVSLLNYKLLFAMPLSLSYTVSILQSLLLGIFTSMSASDTFLLLLNALLVGANITLIAKTIYSLEHMGKVHVSIGGAALITLVTTGCTSCGLSLLSILGLSASLSFLPFHGLELHIAAIGLLLFSLFYMLKQLYNTKYCKIPTQSGSRGK